MAPDLCADADQWVTDLCRQIEADIEREVGVILGTVRPTRDSDYCELSALPPGCCAHCMGHVLDPDLEEITL